MRINQFQMIPREMAVLATHKNDLNTRCYDLKEDGYSYAWVLIDGEGVEDDHLELMEIAMDGDWELCDRCFVVGKDPCPFCGHTYSGHPAISRKDNKTPICPDCGTRQALESLGISVAEQNEILDAIHRCQLGNH